MRIEREPSYNCLVNHKCLRDHNVPFPLIHISVSSDRRLTGFLMRVFLLLLGIRIEEGFSLLYAFKSDNMFVSPTDNVRPNRFRRGFGQQQHNRRQFRNTGPGPRRRAAAALNGVSPLNRQASAQEVRGKEGAALPKCHVQICCIL
ncbi:uap56-interacting factor-like isoform x1 [Limosa lapponica baueri]|uniref:Uap56-interacting factor-like isoform x1 n=1 Tax=Limosa lapponica baueri TaxID=1758121 RepID=A0A2I0TBM4_LIMLA|nr:uap56-interacting factor-like isoform x1 [Limosa lapponica baueri]